MPGAQALPSAVLQGVSAAPTWPVALASQRSTCGQLLGKHRGSPAQGRPLLTRPAPQAGRAAGGQLRDGLCRALRPLPGPGGGPLHADRRLRLHRPLVRPRRARARQPSLHRAARACPSCLWRRASQARRHPHALSWGPQSGLSARPAEPVRVSAPPAQAGGHRPGPAGAGEADQAAEGGPAVQARADPPQDGGGPGGQGRQGACRRESCCLHAEAAWDEPGPQ